MHDTIRPGCVGAGLGALVTVAEAVVDIREVVEGALVALLFAVVGRGSPKLTSTQYACPILMPLQSALTLGFCARSVSKIVDT